MYRDFSAVVSLILLKAHDMQKVIKVCMFFFWFNVLLVYIISYVVLNFESEVIYLQ